MNTMMTWARTALFFAIATLPPINAQARSTGSFPHPDGTVHWYLAVSTPFGITWNNASAAAALAGGYLATITSSSENDFVFSMIEGSEHWQTHPITAISEGPWLGGVQLPGGSEPAGSWTWSELDPFVFQSWTTGQPDDDHRADRINFGGSTNGSVSTWADAPASDERLGFVIEFSGTTAPPTMGLVADHKGHREGYTLFNPLRATSTYLIDMRGRVVNSWSSIYTPGTGIYLLDSGNVLRSGNIKNPDFPVGGAGGIVEEFDWQGNIVWQFQHSTQTYNLHHDLQPLPNGNVLMIAWEVVTGAEAIAAGRDPARVTFDQVWPEKIIEVDRSGTIVWEWHAWDHLIQDFDPMQANYGDVGSHPELIDVNFADIVPDWLHANALTYNENLDQVMISIRSFDEFWVIDHSTSSAEAASHSGGRSGKGGDLLYRWGNPIAYRAGTASDQRLFKQHDPHWIPEPLPGAGNIIIFNNGLGRVGDFSSVDEIVPPPVDANGNYPRPGLAWGPDQPIWSYTSLPVGSFYSRFVSGAQRLPGGNTLVSGGWSGTMLEVTPDKRVVWAYVNPLASGVAAEQGGFIAGNQFFRAPHYASSYSGLSNQTLTPGEPVERHGSAVLVAGSTLPHRVVPGTDVTISLRAKDQVGKPYFVGTSLSPGLTALDYRYLRMAFDGVAQASMANHVPSVFRQYHGTIDSSGVATATLAIPPIQALIGLDFHTTFIVSDASARSIVSMISNTVKVSVVSAQGL